MAFKVQYMLLADSIQNVGSGKLNILGAFDQILPPSLPARLSEFYMVALLVASSEDELGEHQVSYQLIRPTGQPIGESGQTIRVEPNPGAFGLASIRLIWRLAGAPLREPGRHYIVLSVDGRELARHPMEVRLAPAPPLT